jgi:hypothetical protein
MTQSYSSNTKYHILLICLFFAFVTLISGFMALRPVFTNNVSRSRLEKECLVYKNMDLYYDSYTKKYIYSTDAKDNYANCISGTIR